MKRSIFIAVAVLLISTAVAQAIADTVQQRREALRKGLTDSIMKQPVVREVPQPHPNPREHGKGNAFDMELYDPASGKALGNYHDNPQNFPQYQKFANGFHQYLASNYPELAAQHRWGGYFSGGPRTYGSLDLMHHDLAGQRIGMAGGSWDKGLSPQQASICGLQPGGGEGGTQVAAASPRDAVIAKLVANNTQVVTPPDVEDEILTDVVGGRSMADAGGYSYPQTASLGQTGDVQSDIPDVSGVSPATGGAIAATAQARRKGITETILKKPVVPDTEIPKV